MRAIILGVFIAVLLAGEPTRAAVPVLFMGAAPIYELKSMLRKLTRPYRGKGYRRKSAPTPPPASAPPATPTVVAKAPDTPPPVAKNGGNSVVATTTASPAKDSEPPIQPPQGRRASNVAKGNVVTPPAMAQDIKIAPEPPPKGRGRGKEAPLDRLEGKPSPNVSVEVSTAKPLAPQGKVVAKADQAKGIPTNTRHEKPPTKTPSLPTVAVIIPAVTASAATQVNGAEDAVTEGPSKHRRQAVVTSLKPQDLVEFDRQPKRIQRIIAAALAMTEMDLYYAYGSNNPKHGGMDCSGTIQYLLRSQGFQDTPRQADLIFSWSKEQGVLVPANVHRTDAPELKGLRPGDLLFWSGTYNINRSVSHVMMYLGTERSTNRPVMFGASSGRTYHGESRHGVSVFDFKLPRPEEKSRFEGYGPIPGMHPNEREGLPHPG